MLLVGPRLWSKRSGSMGDPGVSCDFMPVMPGVFVSVSARCREIHGSSSRTGAEQRLSNVAGLRA